MRLAHFDPALVTGAPISMMNAGGLVLAGVSGGPALAIGFAIGTPLAWAFLAWV